MVRLLSTQTGTVLVSTGLKKPGDHSLQHAHGRREAGPPAGRNALFWRLVAREASLSTSQKRFPLCAGSPNQILSRARLGRNGKQPARNAAALPDSRRLNLWNESFAVFRRRSAFILKNTPDRLRFGKPLPHQITRLCGGIAARERPVAKDSLRHSIIVDFGIGPLNDVPGFVSDVWIDTQPADDFQRLRMHVHVQEPMPIQGKSEHERSFRRTPQIKFKRKFNGQRAEEEVERHPKQMVGLDEHVRPCYPRRLGEICKTIHDHDGQLARLNHRQPTIFGAMPGVRACAVGAAVDSKHQRKESASLLIRADLQGVVPPGMLNGSSKAAQPTQGAGPDPQTDAFRRGRCWVLQHAAWPQPQARMGMAAIVFVATFACAP